MIFDTECDVETCFPILAEVYNGESWNDTVIKPVGNHEPKQYGYDKFRDFSSLVVNDHLYVFGKNRNFKNTSKQRYI
mgnify:CR=1 FL=1